MINNLTSVAKGLVIGLEGRITDESIQNLIDAGWLVEKEGLIQVAK